MASSAPSSELRNILQFIPKDFNQPEDDVATTRAKMKPFHGQPLAADTTLRETSYGGVASAWLAAGNSQHSKRIALFIHGGGFVSCPMSDYHFYAEHISRELQAQVVEVDYRLAPEALYPAALDDCLTVYQGLLEEGVDPAQIVFTGDSCGGGLALCTLIKARDMGLAMPAAFFGCTPWLDLASKGAETPNCKIEDPFISLGWYLRRAKDYLGDTDPTNPYASPVYADLTGLPPLLLQHGENDMTREDAVKLAAQAGRYGVDLTLEIIPDMVHGFHGLVESVPESKAAWLRAKAFIERLIP